MNCQEHDQQITKICIADHQCQDRRLCVDCILDNHKQVDNKKMPSPQEFLNLLNKKLKDYKEDDYKGFLKTVETLQGKVNVLFEKLKKKTYSIIEIIRLGDKQILDMKDQLTKRPILEYSRGEYNYMKDLLEGNILEHRLYWREQCKVRCQEQLQVLLIKSQSFLDQVEIMTQETIFEQLEGNVKLQGQLLFGLKEGEFYYEYDNGTTEYAGKYELGKKQGAWNDYLGYKKWWGKRIFDSVKYLNGVNIGKDGWPKGQFDQKFSKIGDWLEVDGQWNQFISKGQYKLGQPIGQWYEYYQGDIIGQGYFNDLGQKEGLWTEAIKTYNDNCQVTFTGEYRNGIRFGKWYTTYEGNNIGGGSYDEKGVKIGEWTDLHENFRGYCQVTITGEYRNGMRFGKWSTAYKGNDIGGGSYDDREVKIGQWTDLYENFDYNCQVTITGEYRNGIRFGKWSTAYKGNNIGGGSYDEKGVKIGQWTDLHEDFRGLCQVTFTGEYRNGIRFGKWQTTYDGKHIGGGSYDEKGLKIGQWTDLHENFHNLCEVTITGEYRNGIRFGKWSTAYKGNNIGGGSYDEKGVKIGQWTDLHENFRGLCQVTFTGEYRNGIRFGKWQTTYDGKNMYVCVRIVSGGGSYDEKGLKIGQWTDLHENFDYLCEVTITGEYRNGIRFGKWSTAYKGNNIGGGSYDEKGVKIGQWTDLHENFRGLCQVTFTGEYRNGIRFGKWQTTYDGKNIGGGSYDEKGLKIGQWTDLHENFHHNCQVTITGEYSFGYRLGKWNKCWDNQITLYKQYSTIKFLYKSIKIYL